MSSRIPDLNVTVKLFLFGKSIDIGTFTQKYDSMLPSYSLSGIDSLTILCFTLPKKTVWIPDVVFEEFCENYNQIPILLNKVKNISAMVYVIIEYRHNIAGMAFENRILQFVDAVNAEVAISQMRQRKNQTYDGSGGYLRRRISDLYSNMHIVVPLDHENKFNRNHAVAAWGMDIIADSLDIPLITSILGVPATKTTAEAYAHWTCYSPERHVSEIGEIVDDFMEKFGTSGKQLKQIVKQFNAQIMIRIVIYFQESIFEVVFSKNFLSFANSIGGVIDVDQYLV